MRSLAKRHKAQALAKVASMEARAAAQAQIENPAPSVGFSGYAFEVVNAQFERHLEQLKALVDVKDKEAFKAKVLPDYLAYLESYKKSGEHYSNPVLSRVIFWLLDTNDLHNAFNYAALAIQQQQLAPKGFKRDLTTAIVETIHDWAERQYKSGLSAEPYLTDTANLCLTDTWLVSEIIVLTKLYKLKALVAEKAQDDKTALAFYEHCVRVNPEKHGVKTKLNACKARLAHVG